MSGWQVDPVGAEKTLNDTQTHVNEVGTALAGLANGVGDSLATGAGFDGVVVKAFAGFIEEQSSGRLLSLMNRYTAGLEATATAANAFLVGDEQMASSTIAAASDAAAVADVTSFSGGN